MKLAGGNINEITANMVQLKKWQPFKYSGAWFAAMINGQGYAFKTQKALEQRALKAGLSGMLEFSKIG